jgi:hypothetical protein
MVGNNGYRRFLKNDQPRSLRDRPDKVAERCRPNARPEKGA